MYTAIASNKRKTFLLIILFILVISGFGWLFSEIKGTPVVFYGVAAFAIVYAWLGYYFSSKLALAMNGAKKITKEQNPRLWRTVENLAITSGLPMPDVYIIDDPAPNAFATGRDPQHAVVAATTGLLDMMTDSELEGVIAHELSHIGNYDIRVMSIVIALVTIIAVVSDIFLRFSFLGDDDHRGAAILAIVGLIAALLAPIVATLLKLAVSRQREYLADASGVMLTRYPDGLASALAKIGSYGRPMRRANATTAHLFIANPLSGKVIAHIFSTHPPVEERIRRIQAIGDEI